VGKVTLTIPDDLEERLRRKAAEKYGLKRGFLRKAVIEAIRQWLENNP